MTAVTLILSSQVTYRVPFEVDDAEFAEWAGSDEMTPEKVKEFIEADRDRDEILESAVSRASHRLDQVQSDYIDLDRVEIG